MKLLIIIAVIIFGIWMYSNQQDSGPAKLEPTKNHRTAAKNYMEAILKRNKSTAEFYSSGMAKDRGYDLIMGMLSNYPSEFIEYRITLGGTSKENRNSGYANMYGTNEDMFCTTSFIVEKIDGYWYVVEIDVNRVNQ